MISRREKYRNQVITTYIKNYLKYYISNIEIDSLTFLDELYLMIAQRIAEIGNIGSVNFKYIDEYEFVKSEHFTNIIKEVRAISDFSFQIVPNIYSELEIVSNTILELSEELTADIENCNKLMETAESSIKRQTAMSSVKNEIIVYDTIGDRFSSSAGTLTVDKRSGSIFLNVISTYNIPFTINSADCNREKGIINKPSKGDTTWRNITNGYFNSRTFSAVPLFENEEYSDINRMKDDDIETSYMVEYNSFTKSSPLELNINISPDETGRIDAIELSVDPSDIESVLSTSLSLPILNKLVVTDNKGITKDVSTSILDNTIKIERTVIGTVEKKVTYQSPDIYPVVNYNINNENIDNIIINLNLVIPQEIWYPEEVIKDSFDNSVYRFNYFETLIIGGYEPSDNHLDPRDYYTTSEIAEIISHRLSNKYLFQDKIHLFRYFIGIKEIKLMRYTYNTTGNIISSNLNDSGKLISGIQIYVNEIIPEGCSISYYISFDTNEWYQILPDNRDKSIDIPSRILLYDDISNTKYDKVIDIESSTVYLKIEMTGAQQETPILKSYAVRIKTL